MHPSLTPSKQKFHLSIAMFQITHRYVKESLIVNEHRREFHWEAVVELAAVYKKKKNS